MNICTQIDLKEGPLGRLRMFLSKGPLVSSMAAKTVQNEGSGMHVCLILIITLQLIDSHAIAFEIIYYLHDSMMYISILSSF